MNPAIRPRPLLGGQRCAALALRVEPLAARVHADDLRWLAAQLGYTAEDPVADLRSLLASAQICRTARGESDARADRLRELVLATPEAGRLELLERYLRSSVRLRDGLLGDLLALRRDLDLDALLEREAAVAERQGIRLELVAQALGDLSQEVPLDDWDRAGAPEILNELVTSERRPATRRAAARALALATGRAIADGGAHDPTGLRLLRERVRDPQEDPWVRRRALEVVRGLPSALARHLLLEALSFTTGREPFLLRSRATELLLERSDDWVPTLAARLLRDPSELVRASLVDGLAARFSRADEAAGAMLSVVLGGDPEPRVRARAALSLGAAGERGLRFLAPSLRELPLVARSVAETALTAARAGHRLPDALRQELEEATRGAPPEVARAAALALRAEQVVGTPIWAIAAPLERLRPGQRLKLTLPREHTALELAEALTLFAASGYGYSLEPSRSTVLVTRGDVLGATTWRLLHELRSPAPAKRQGHPHVLGRLDAGRIRVPPGGLAEESATGVPGERVRVERVGGWAPSLPLVDDYLHAADRRQVLVVTAEGHAALTPPSGVLRPLLARARLSLQYARFDALRTSGLEESDLAPRYLEALSALGYQTRFERRASARVQRSLSPISYLLGMGESTITHLAVVTLLLVASLLGRVAWARRRVRAARARLPLVVGGWGTRGKSGTERLKAGMFEGLGVSTLSKTTGCEAMVLHAPPGGHAMELFLFRPYDRATIWEQVEVVDLAAGLGARTMLWECMGLNPAYVQLLQRSWMRDDLSTLTNAYPDHEDIQGPTGMDVAAVLGGFAPPDALLLTTEENMLPVIAELGAARGATVEPVRGAARDLVPRDLLDRLPYAEHHANVALAAAVGEALGVDRVEAIGLMAEHVVPDLGALVIYPRARHLGREVVFANGMSANDTLSFRHNWRRTGYAAHDHLADPARWLITVVNNRADRVARSRVFAQILVHDANAHRHVLIGTNLRGLTRYLDQAIADRLSTLDEQDPGAIDRLFQHLRLVDPSALGVRCGVRLGAPEPLQRAWSERAAAVRSPGPSLEQARAAAEGARAEADALEQACDEGAGLADALVETLARWCCARAAREAPPVEAGRAWASLMREAVILVEDPGATGDQIIARALQAAPPGVEVWLMGVQNIKGTGLDFAYQWVFWRDLQQCIEKLRNRSQDRRLEALTGIEQNPLGSALACEAALEALRPLLVDADLSARAAALFRRVEARRDDLLAARTGAPSPAARQPLAVKILERVLDPFDAILRSRRARQILADLVRQRISHRRAQAALRDLSARQKGSWLGAPGD